MAPNMAADYLFTFSVLVTSCFYPRDVVSGVLATTTCLAGWLGVRHTPVLYQNGKTYLKTFSTIWSPHHSSFF